MSNSIRKTMSGRGVVGKTAVVGIKDRDSNHVSARVIESTDAVTLQGFVIEHTDANAMVYTDEATAYVTLPFRHEVVKHSTSEYVRDMAHINGVETFWSMLKRAHKALSTRSAPST